ncbi:hypothetical protein CPB84DRAFT_1843967 [Gymnopilus junonius]|uniref:Uncharacterized protein n=1 Tax=Gymnopilus junonius TaxID=109634 RepID=A0A9P5NWV9_GYMJU|nr:hypothetical protein CPB84DRAFT_1843967 [Gymnopilus junonius]
MNDYHSSCEHVFLRPAGCLKPTPSLMPPTWLGYADPPTAEERRCAQKRDFYRLNVFSECEKVHRQAEHKKNSLSSKEEAQRLCREHQWETDAHYRAVHCELLRLKAIQYCHAKKQHNEIVEDEAEFQQLMSQDFEVVVGFGVDGELCPN